MALRVPALRERADDALLLASRFLGLHARRYGLLAPRLTPVAVRVIRHHDWPGNIRELERAMARAVIFAEGGWARPEDLDLDDAARGEERAAGPIGAAPPGSPNRLSGRQCEVLRLARLQGTVRRGDLMRRFGISRETARQELIALVRLGGLRRVGWGAGAYYEPREPGGTAG